MKTDAIRFQLNGNEVAAVPGETFRLERLPVGSRIDLRIPVPPALRHHFGGRSAYAVKAVVCRLEAIEGGATYRIGARFLGELEA